MDIIGTRWRCNIRRKRSQANGGPLPPNHPANFCMFVLVGMQDDGLLILPTHRLIGGVPSFDIEALRRRSRRWRT